MFHGSPEEYLRGMDKAIPHFQPLYNPMDRRDRGVNKNFTPEKPARHKTFPISRTIFR
jgi:hypothetical protein